MTKAATTERRRYVSVRTRIIAVILVLTAAAMAGAGFFVYVLQADRIQHRATEHIDQEIAELTKLRKDPDTGRPFKEVERLLEVFLSRNVPDDDEMLVGYTGGTEKLRSRNRHGEEIFSHPGYRAAVADLSADGGFRSLETKQFGEVWVTVVPVRAADRSDSGALAMVTFLDDEYDDLNSTMSTYAVVAALSLVLIAAIATLQSGRLLAPLRRLRRTTEEITESDLARRVPETGNDDITALTRTVNDMLARLESAFTGQRQFLDDAGHELKTPLTVVRGHLELLDPDDPDDVATTRQLLVDEVDRMGRLVGDLILLAKARRPDFLHPRLVDVSDLVHAVAAKARGLADRRWEVDGTSDTVLEVDEQRITQAMLQLAENAAKHTGPGDVIAFGAATTVQGTVLWVRDTGPGVPAADRVRVLERFGRSTPSPDDEGFGLGLSVVGAIAEAHGGSVRIEDAADYDEPPGAMVLLVIPDHRMEE